MSAGAKFIACVVFTKKFATVYNMQNIKHLQDMKPIKRVFLLIFKLSFYKSVFLVLHFLCYYLSTAAQQWSNSQNFVQIASYTNTHLIQLAVLSAELCNQRLRKCEPVIWVCHKSEVK